MAYNLVALPNAWAVDQAIVSEEDRVVIIRWGQEATPECMLMDKTLAGVVTKLQNMAVIYTVDIEDIPDFNKMYELYDPVCIMFFFKNKHIMVDVGTGNNNKSTFNPFHCRITILRFPPNSPFLTAYFLALSF